MSREPHQGGSLCGRPRAHGSSCLPPTESRTSLSLLPFCSPVDSELTSLCQSVLEDFNLCLFYLPPSPSLSLASEGEEDYEGGYAFLPDLLIFQMVIICLMGVHSLKRAGNSLCPAFSPGAAGGLAAHLPRAFGCGCEGRGTLP